VKAAAFVALGSQQLPGQTVSWQTHASGKRCFQIEALHSGHPPPMNCEEAANPLPSFARESATLFQTRRSALGLNASSSRHAIRNL